VGANVGDWTAAALHINPRVEIHCFEPHPATFAVLKGRSNAGNVHYNPVGLGESPSEMDLQIYGDTDGMNSLYVRSAPIGVQGRQRVTLTSIDEYCRINNIGRIDLLKIDVEGHEFAVLRGARQALSDRRIAMAQFEYGGTFIDSHTFLRDIWEYLKDVQPSFEFYKIVRNGVLHVPKYDPRLDDFKYSNWVVAVR
jgi:FkbM family methyltransferase